MPCAFQLIPCRDAAAGIACPPCLLLLRVYNFVAGRTDGRGWPTQSNLATLLKSGDSSVELTVHRNSLWAAAEVYARLDGARLGVSAILCHMVEERVDLEQQAEEEPPVDEALEDTAMG